MMCLTNAECAVLRALCVGIADEVALFDNAEIERIDAIRTIERVRALVALSEHALGVGMAGDGAGVNGTDSHTGRVARGAIPRHG